MSYKPSVSTLDASTVDILNVIRANAGFEYQSLVPKISKPSEVVSVGEVLVGYPALANQFLNALMNRIALVNVRTASFYNDFAELKKGFLEYGETIEEVFVNIAKAREFSAEKAEGREFKRTIPDVRSAFHVINWRVQYPVTIQDQDLKQAFLSVNGVQDLIARIVDSVYNAQAYDEYLLFKYLIIKAINKGNAHTVNVRDYKGLTDLEQSAAAFRGISNAFTLMSKQYNASGVHTVTPRNDQFIFMDAKFNAEFDVNVLASAFNMDKTDFIGRLKLVDSWTTFDNERFEEIASNSDMIELITPEELKNMENVQAVLCDREFFQFYDNQFMFTEKYVASGLYWNYFLNVWKTISYSPFSNIAVFRSGEEKEPETVTVEVAGKTISDNATVLELVIAEERGNFEFVQTAEMTQDGVAMHRYGALMIPADKVGTDYEIYVKNANSSTVYQYEHGIIPITLNGAAQVGDTVTISRLTIA